MSDIFQKNMNAGLSRFPLLFRKILDIDYASIDVVRTQDGGYCYARNNAGKLVPISNHIDPLQSTQAALTKMQHRIGSGLAPAVVIGLNPGFLLEIVFRHFKSRVQLGEPFRRIYVIIDSTECLAGWLKAADRTEILIKNEVEFYWHEDIRTMVEVCEKDEQRSHLFIPVSSLSESLMEKIMQPLANLYLKRQKETELWLRLNEEYYDQLDDVRLAEIFHGRAGRKPRLLMPAHSSSTVVQYSTRDVCQTFERMGWETRILSMDWDLSDWRLSKSIYEFKPDLLIFINHLRTEDNASGVYPENMLYITWIQDTMQHLNNRKTAELWNKFALGTHSRTGKPRKRDLIVGYTDIIKPFGYAEERMTYLPMIVDSATFHPRKLTPEQIKKYGCDVCFASNKGKTTEEVFETELYPYLAAFNISKESGWEIHNLLWKIYREEKTITSYPQLEGIICSGVPSFDAVFSRIEDRQIKDNIIQKIFWALNDVIYRHIVLEWCDELGIKLNLYGKYWGDHPRFKKYAKGVIAHGEELSIAYQAAKYCLHLNSIEGTHQRSMEIGACNALCLTRQQQSSCHLATLLMMCKKRREIFQGESVHLEPAEEADWESFIFKTAISAGVKTSFESALASVGWQICERFMERNILLSADMIFNSKDDLKALLGDVRLQKDFKDVCDSESYNTYIANAVFRMIIPDRWSIGVFKTRNEEMLCKLALSINNRNCPEVLNILRDWRCVNPEVLLHVAFFLIRNMMYEAASEIFEGISYEDVNALDGLPYYFQNLTILEDRKGKYIDENWLGQEIELAYRQKKSFKNIYANIGWNIFWPRGNFKTALRFFEKDYNNGNLSDSFLGQYSMILAATGEVERCMRIADENWKKSSDEKLYSSLLGILSEKLPPSVDLLAILGEYVSRLSDAPLVLNWIKAICRELLLSPQEIVNLYHGLKYKDDNIRYEIAEALALRGAHSITSQVLGELDVPTDASESNWRACKIEYFAGCVDSDCVLERLCAYYKSHTAASGIFLDFARQVFIPLRDYRNIIRFLEKELEYGRCVSDDIYLLIARAYADINDVESTCGYIRKVSSPSGTELLGICDAFIHFDQFAAGHDILELYAKNEILSQYSSKYCCYAYECGLKDKAIAAFDSACVSVKLEICRTFFSRNHVDIASDFFLMLDAGLLCSWDDKLDYLVTADTLYDKKIFELRSEKITALYRALLKEAPMDLRLNQEYVRYLGMTGNFKAAEEHAAGMHRKYGMNTLYIYIASALTPKITDHYAVLPYRSKNEGSCLRAEGQMDSPGAVIMRKVVGYMEMEDTIDRCYYFLIKHLKYLLDDNIAEYRKLPDDFSRMIKEESYCLIWYCNDLSRYDSDDQVYELIKRIGRIDGLSSAYCSEYIVLLYCHKINNHMIGIGDVEYFSDYVTRNHPRMSECNQTLDILDKIAGKEKSEEYRKYYCAEKYHATYYMAYILRFCVRAILKNIHNLN